MASYTDNYALTKPTMAESADIRVINSNMDTVDDVLHSTQISLAPAYDLNETYNTGDVVMYELLMYECLEDDVTGAWDATKWQRTTAGEHGGGSDVEVTQIQTEGKAVASIAVDGVSTDILIPELKVYGEATGDLITIEDAMEAPLEECKVTLEPQQDLSQGDPSPTNICPISGWDEANVTRCGKNVFGGLPMAENIVEVGRKATLDTTNKTVAFTSSVPKDGSYERSISEGFKFKENTIYTFVATYSNSGNNSSLRFRNTTGTNQEIQLANTNGQKTKIAVTTSRDYSLKDIILSFYSASSTTLYYEESGIFEGVLTADDFEPYNGQTYTIQLGSTCYGGELDVKSGVLKVTDGYIASYNGETLPSTWISDRDVYAPNTSPTTGAEVVYKLTTTQEIQLTPTEVTLLRGINNLWSDGEMYIKYRRDIEMLLQRIADSLGGNA